MARVEMSRENKNLETEGYIQHRDFNEGNYKVTDRRTEIARLVRRKKLSLVLWLGSTGLVFQYLWVFNYGLYDTPEKGLIAVLMATVLVAITGAFFYFNERRIANPKIERLMKYEILFDEFFEAMITDMERNHDLKGDTWKTMNFSLLRELQLKKWGQIRNNHPSTILHRTQEPKLANYSAMIYLRRKHG